MWGMSMACANSRSPHSWAPSLGFGRPWECCPRSFLRDALQQLRAQTANKWEHVLGSLITAPKPI